MLDLVTVNSAAYVGRFRVQRLSRFRHRDGLCEITDLKLQVQRIWLLGDDLHVLQHLLLKPGMLDSEPIRGSR